MPSQQTRRDVYRLERLGFAAFGIIFTLFIVGVVIAHAMILFG